MRVVFRQHRSAWGKQEKGNPSQGHGLCKENPPHTSLHTSGTPCTALKKYQKSRPQARGTNNTTLLGDFIGGQERDQGSGGREGQPCMEEEYSQIAGGNKTLTQNRDPVPKQGQDLAVEESLEHTRAQTVVASTDHGNTGHSQTTASNKNVAVQ